MEYRKFDYYIFIDYSENLIGYVIINNKRMVSLIPKISKFRHYKEARNKKLYLKNAKKTINREKIKSFFLKHKIKKMYNNAEIYLDVLEFLKKYKNCIIFISIDNRQFEVFKKLVGFVDSKRVIVKKESELLKGTPEYQISLVIDNILNIERLKEK